MSDDEILARIAAKHDAGERLTDDELSQQIDLGAKLLAREVWKYSEEVRQKDNKPVLYSQGTHDAARLAIRLLSVAMVQRFAGAREKRLDLEERLIARLDQLERRLAALEPGKPRQRVRAIGRAVPGARA